MIRSIYLIYSERMRNILMKCQRNLQDFIHFCNEFYCLFPYSKCSSGKVRKTLKYKVVFNTLA